MIDLDAAGKLDAAKLDTGELLALLADVAKDLDETLARQQALYDVRTKLFVAARQRSPRVTLGQLAEASGASEAAVTQVLHKVRRAAG